MVTHSPTCACSGLLIGLAWKISAACSRKDHLYPNTKPSARSETSPRRPTPYAEPNLNHHRFDCRALERVGRFCYQDDQDPKQMSKVYWGVCDDDPECKKKHTDEPWLGYLSWQPHGAALARTSNRFEIYDKQDANCISASDDETSDGAE